jgi:cell division protein FtsB
MKKKPKKSLSPLQRKRLVKVIAILGFLAVLWLLFAPDMGIVSLQRERNRLEDLKHKKITLEEENAALLKEMDRIQNDIDYFERLAREKHGLLKKNEIIFDFSKEQKEKE